MLENKRKPSACVAACRSKQNMKRAFKGEREKTVGESKQGKHHFLANISKANKDSIYGKQLKCETLPFNSQFIFYVPKRKIFNFNIHRKTYFEEIISFFSGFFVGDVR